MTTFVDLFCGAGLGARGAYRAGGRPLIALDFWSLATRTYQYNFPDTAVITGPIQDVTPSRISRGISPDVLLTSPECTAHSIARGSRPGSERSRESALGIVPWINALNPRWVIVENVNQMKRWSRHSELVETIEDLGYAVSDLYLNAADFGSPQARKRMFLVCDRSGTKVAAQDLIPANTSLKCAEHVVDWNGSYPSKPLFSAGRAPNTLERANRAIRELGRGIPFLIVYYGSDYAGGWQRLDAPLRTVTTIDRFGLVTWQGDTAMLRMLQPLELLSAMGAPEHELPFGNRREKIKMLGNGVCSDVMESIFAWIARQKTDTSEIAA